MADHIEQFFSYDHLPEPLQDVSRPFAELAERIVSFLPRNPERTVALRKLLEAKDAAVRAFIAKDPVGPGLGGGGGSGTDAKPAENHD